MIFQHDNAPAHSSHITRDWLAKEGIKNSKLMKWPSLSPDLNPIENFWSFLKREVYKQNMQYNSKEDLWKSIKKESAKISFNQIKKLTKSMDKESLS